MDCLMMEKAPVMRAWLATTAARVATTNTGQKTGSGTEAKKALAACSGKRERYAACPK